MERIALALIRTHGFEPDTWSAEILSTLRCP
jgi:hypothetical protein